MRTDWTQGSPPAVCLSAAEALDMDRWLIEERGFTLPSLMAEAGARLAETVEERRAAWGSERLAFLVGPGNNGGDALVARELLGAESAGPIWRPLRAEAPPPLDATWLVVDGLFGVGLARPVEGDAAQALERVRASGAKVLAVDVPSGLDATTGRVLGAALAAHATLAFVLPKQGFFVGEGPAHTGAWRAVEIGFAAREAVDWVLARRRASPPS